MTTDITTLCSNHMKMTTPTQPGELSSIWEMTRESMEDALTRYRIPAHLHDGMIEWAINAQRPGGFLSAVISNDLFQSFATADPQSAEALGGIVKWFYNSAPSRCHGKGALADWRGMEGVE